MNAEFQRIARRDKKAFLSDQCNGTEENNRMGKTRDLFKKIRATKGTFHAITGTIKDRNGMDLTEAEDIKKRWKNTQKNYTKKCFNDRYLSLAVKVLHSICQQIWKIHQCPQNWKRSIFIPVPKKGNAKECPNYCTIALILHTNKIMLTILQTRLQSM